jgi:prepilin-type N-terminal cleavage/methylation domain-containing protein
MRRGFTLIELLVVIAIVAILIEDYVVDHPKTALLVVEVADTTLEADTHEKASLYAAGGVADYWVLDVTDRLLVFHDPRPDAGQPFGSVYAGVSAFGRDDTVTPLAAPDKRVQVSDLLS